MFQSIDFKKKNKCYFVSANKIQHNEHYYRHIPVSDVDMNEIRRDLDIGINMILDGIDSLSPQDDCHDVAIDKILDGLFMLTYQRYLMD